MKICTILPLIALSGCQTTQPVAVDIAPLSAQIGQMAEANTQLARTNEQLRAANLELTAANEQLMATLRADVDAGIAAIAQGWLPFVRYVLNHMNTLLPFEPDATTAARWDEAAELYRTGGKSAIQGVIAELRADASKLNERLGELTSNALQLEKERDRAVQAANEALHALEQKDAEVAERIRQAVEADRKAIRDAQVKLANAGAAGCGIVAIALAAAALFVSPKTKGGFVTLAFFFAAASITSFAVARWLGSPQFILSVIALWSVGFLGWLAWRIRKGASEQKAQEESEAANKSLALIRSASTKIIKAGDKVYEDRRLVSEVLPSGDKSTMSDVAEYWFSLENLTNEEKAEVHLVRARDKINAAPF